MRARLLSSIFPKYFSTSKTNIQSVQFLLDKIRAQDNLPTADRHIEHLVVGNSGSSNSNGVDFSDKTRLILQSSHPIRYIVEREVVNLQKASKFVSYHNWITLFGRALDVKITTAKEREIFNTNLNLISNAAEVGMLSSKVHEIVLDIPPPLDTNLDKWEQFYMGNKYAVLVGDYFAVKTVFYTQKTKVNKVFLCITRGIEDFTSVSFFSNLMDKNVWYPIIAAPEATLSDWENYAEKVSGYFTGGLNAVLNISKNEYHSSPEFMTKMKEFRTNLTRVLKLVDELDLIKNFPGPQICVTLPAIIHHSQNPNCFNQIKGKSLLVTDDDFKMVQRELLHNSTVLEQVHQLALKYGAEAEVLIEKIGVDPFYVDTFQQLIESTVNEVIQKYK